MKLKLIGAFCILLGCGGWGFYTATMQKIHIQMLRQMQSAVEMMECDLQYRRTPLSRLFQTAGEMSGGRLGKVFLMLAQELDAQVAPNAACCMAVVLEKYQSLPADVVDLFNLLGSTMGKFHLEGQLMGLEAVRSGCEYRLKRLLDNIDARIRSYQTLGLCAGAALAILFL